MPRSYIILPVFLYQSFLDGPNGKFVVLFLLEGCIRVYVAVFAVDLDTLVSRKRAVVFT